MATMATRSGRGLLALIFIAMACIFAMPNFSFSARLRSLLGSVPQRGQPAGTTILHKIDEVEMRLDAGNIGSVDQKLLSEDIQILEDLIQDSMELETTTQVEWLEDTLQTVATLKKRLARQQAADQQPAVQQAAAFQEKGLPATFQEKELLHSSQFSATFLAVGVLAFFLAGVAALNIHNTRVRGPFRSFAHNVTAPRNILPRLWSYDTTKTSALHRFRRGEEFKLFTQKDTNTRDMTAPRNI